MFFDPIKKPSAKSNRNSMPVVAFGPGFCTADFYTMHDPVNDRDWAVLAKSVSIYQFFGEVFENRNAAYKPEQLKRAIQVIRKNKLQVGVELGGARMIPSSPKGAGVGSAEYEYSVLKRNLLDQGATVDVLAFDNDIPGLMAGGWPGNPGYNLEQAIEQVVRYLEYMHRHLPKTRFNTVCSFPNWRYQGTPSATTAYDTLGDYADVLQKLVQTCRKQGVPLDGIQIDNPYDYYLKGTSSERVKNLIAQSIGLGLSVTFYVNTERGLHFTRPDIYPNTTTPTKPYGAPRAMSDKDIAENQQYQSDTLNFADDLSRLYPDTIQTWLFESWHRAPFRAMPVSDKLSYAATAIRGAEVISRNIKRYGHKAK